jgi:hypothetical protein
MNGVDVVERGHVVVHEAEDFLADACVQFDGADGTVPGNSVLEAAQTAIYYALGWWLDAPVIVSPLADGLLTLARARTGQAPALGALQRARTRVGQAAYYLPRHPTEPTSEIQTS